ncbi:type IA DNA topoisomerase [Bifidobacterium aerophilum]|uniref:DNA topoisomerase n=1 Tax=Bifidobacterium aerophilum TaxID=1798155 RepID=A0A6N9Z556_9BIFI|nr:type IA DNA topoisomerase [Bifidobacterium aerophilum]NEG89849.1 type IA DNA topoisomerase [Bifidobacterium aerophilum]
MRLVIAEKRSVALAIAQALDPNPQQSDDYIQADGNLVSWAQGHLVDLTEPDGYEQWSDPHWSMGQLPIIPQQWKWKIRSEKGAGSRYRTLVSLMRRPDVDTLVNACDPDREGEGIFHRIVAHSGIHKPALRLWVASLDEHAIRSAWQGMKPIHDYQGLAAASDARAKSDWLIGMNATRAYTLTYRQRLNVGRVQTPTLAMIVARDEQIAGHKPTLFWTVIADMGGWHLTSSRIDSQAVAENLCAEAENGVFRILKTERKTVHDKPPRLYDLTSLQKDMSRLHGMTAAATLAALQHLYELKLATYPRTDSQYITGDDLPMLQQLTGSQRIVQGFVDRHTLTPAPRLELTVNDGKVAGHTAILPTLQLDGSRLAGLTDGERHVAVRIVRRMWEAIGDDHTHLVTTVEAQLDGGNDMIWTSRSDETIRPGWKGISPEPAVAAEENNDETDPVRSVIPANLTDGIITGPVGPVTVKQGETKPPKPYTEATLLSAMEHASRTLEDKNLKHALDDDALHSGGIGTPATRAGIIEQLVSGRYVERKGKQLRSTDKGRLLISVVTPELKDVALTARWEQTLTDLAESRDNIDGIERDFLSQVASLCEAIPEKAEASLAHVPRPAQTDKESFGACPRCGKPVIKTGSLWQCSSNKSEKTADGEWKQTEGCGFKIFGTLSGKKLTDATIRKLLAGKQTRVSGFVSRRTGKGFDAILAIDPERGVRMQFDR